MYKFYIVPDATIYNSHAELYSHMQLFWDPQSESDAYAVIEPKLKTELNKSSQLEFSVLPANIHYDDFHKKKTVVIAYNDDEWLFEGMVSDAPVDFYKQRNVTCIDPLTYLCDSIFGPDEKNAVEVPTSSSTTARYLPVTDTERFESNPSSKGWYEQNIVTGNNGQSVTYTRTSDTTNNTSKTYYYQTTGDGKNHSGQTVTKKTATVETIQQHLTRLINNHNAQMANCAYKTIHLGSLYSSNDTETHEFKAANFRSTWDAIKSDILDNYGRYITITLGQDHNIYMNYIELDQISSNVQLVEFTNNMIEMNESDNQDDNMFTVLIPIGKDNLTVSGSTGNTSPTYNDGRLIDPYLVTLGGVKNYIVVSPAAIHDFGYIIRSQSFSDVTDANELYEKGKEYIYYNFGVPAEYEVRAIDLKFIGESDSRIKIADKCHLRSQWHGIDSTDLYFKTIESDLANPENDSYTIGIPTSDKDARNKTLTGQSDSSRRNSASSVASYSSGMGSMGSILENYIHVTEWGLEANSRLRNEYEASSEMSKTLFEQDEYHLRLMAQKIFGDKQEDNQDAGFIAIPASQTVGKNPRDMHWYVLKDGKYVLTEDTEPKPGVTYYAMRLWTRISNIDVGMDGIHARVSGNYERSISSASWIDLNEDSINAVTGHVHVDSEGKVIIDAGAGARTGYKVYHDDPNSPVFIQVKKSRYTGASPSADGWFERTSDSSGAWPGAGKADQTTNANYYQRSTDTTANQNKYYYVKSITKEEFVAEYGIFDQGNFTAGVVAQAVNNPTYVAVQKHLYPANTNPSTQNPAWYVYDEQTGTYGQTLDTTMLQNTIYYLKTNNMTTFTDIRGDHIVIGKTDSYDGLNANTKAKIDEYITNNKLDGTITEIASDVVTVNALFAHYIRTDYLQSEYNELTSIWSDDLFARNSVQTMGDVTINVGTRKEIAVSNGIESFGTATYSGDSVTIPYWTLSNPQSGLSAQSPSGTITFNKPASRGTATWGDGYTLTVPTAGGTTFFSANLEIPELYLNSGTSFEKKGQNFNTDDSTEISSTSELYNNPTIKVTRNIRGIWDGMPSVAHEGDTNPIANWSKAVYINATKAFDAGVTDGTNTAKGKIGASLPETATADSEAEDAAIQQLTALDYDKAYMYYGTYDGTKINSKRFFKTPADRYNDGIAYAKGKFGLSGIEAAVASNATENAALSQAVNSPLSYATSYMYYSKYDGSRYSSKVFFRTPADRYNTGWNAARGKCTIPTAQNLSSGTLTCAWPASTPGTATPEAKDYVLNVTNSYGQLKYGSTVVAQVSHSYKYTQTEYNAALATVPSGYVKASDYTANSSIEDNKTAASSYTSNNTYSITPSSGKVAMKKVTFTVAVPQGSSGITPSNDISINSPKWYNSNDSLPSTNATLSTMGNILNNHKNGRGYIYFNVTIAGVSGSKVYRLPVGSA